ncbi:MAG: hypothetical protein FRX48_06983 [Lasallia pustulata]|uniref:Uncharacterized protein n=1 Tax=Lasallia pustulata TaxID=136370 RepID=A0A5M8PK76_9LECA|nr:MAG: hypothetical protein FRX48_06983 [Lasallia pustulata]
MLLELGCGIAGMTAMALAPRVRRTSQPRRAGAQVEAGKTPSKEAAKTPGVDGSAVEGDPLPGFQVFALNWETTSVSSLAPTLGESASGLNLVLTCGCNYSPYLFEPFVRACAENTARPPVACLIAQQLRPEPVFEAWLASSMREFAVRKVPDELLDEDLQSSKVFVLHSGILKTAAEGWPLCR